MSDRQHILFSEEEWSACDDPLRLLSAKDLKVSQRRWRLFVLACCRELWGASEDQATQLALDSVEHLAEFGGPGASIFEIRLLKGHAVLDCSASEPLERLEVFTPEGTWQRVSPSEVNFSLVYALEQVSCYQPNYWNMTYLVKSFVGEGLAGVRQAELLRDIIRGPFGLPSFNPEWRDFNDSAVWNIAQSILDDQTFEQLPILADALEDAGCEDAALLGHLRSAGPHCRNCWAVDVVQGKL